MGLGAPEIAEVLALFRAMGGSDDLNRLLDEPFGPGAVWRNRGQKSRFSDGSFPVLYSALDRATGETEARHWFIHRAIGGAKPRVHYYDCFSFDYAGETIDLSPLRTAWPGLTHPDYYSFCNRLGAEAVASGLDGFVAPSARYPDGSCLPVFKRRAVSSPKRIAHAAFSIDAASGNVSITYAE